MRKKPGTDRHQNCALYRNRWEKDKGLHGKQYYLQGSTPRKGEKQFRMDQVWADLPNRSLRLWYRERTLTCTRVQIRWENECGSHIPQGAMT